VCISRILLLGGDGGACTSGLSGACLGCYTGFASCGASCASSCNGSGPNQVNGCDCIDCIEAACGASFAACAGYGQGTPDADDSSGPGTIGGPPICESIPVPDCVGPRGAGGGPGGGAGGAGGMGGAGMGGAGGMGGFGGAGGPVTDACTNVSDSTYVCTWGSIPPTIKETITACGVCDAIGFGCPNDCSGDAVVPGTPAAACISRTLLLGGDGGACINGLSADCLSCYTDYASCGAGCSPSCSGTGATGPQGCQCLDCIVAACDASFTTCAGYSQGAPSSDDGSGPAGGLGTVGGPAACPAIPTPDCIGPRL
jgi:hypothetical protein